jgi:hypothetical protein
MSHESDKKHSTSSNHSSSKLASSSKPSEAHAAHGTHGARFVDFDKDEDGVEVGLLTLTNGKTSEWYTESVVDHTHNYFDPLNEPLGWKLDVLIVCGHGRAGGTHLATDEHTKVSLEELAAFIGANMKVKRILLNACHAGDSGKTPGNSFANKLSKLVNATTYGPVESIQRADLKGKFYHDKKYHWNRYKDNHKSELGEHTLSEFIPFVLHHREMATK